MLPGTAGCLALVTSRSRLTGSVAHHHLREHEQAIGCYQQALKYWEDRGDLTNQVEALTHIGDAQHALGNQTGACEAWQRALYLLEQLGHPDAKQMRARIAAVS